MARAAQQPQLGERERYAGVVYVCRRQRLGVVDYVAGIAAALALAMHRLFVSSPAPAPLF
jgi:hypothetical protein